MNPGRKSGTLVALSASLLASAALSPAHAALTITTAATADVICDSNVCLATSANAKLNVGSLETMLASADVSVVSGSTAKDIVVAAPLSWASAKNLTLDSYRFLTVDKAVSVNGIGGLTIITGGTFLFAPKADIAFLSTANSLIIGGTSYTLVDNIASLANDIATNASGNFALANSYNAKSDGVYGHAPIPTAFTGSFTGLGNTISNLKIDDTTDTGNSVGLFANLGGGGSISDLVLQSAKIKVFKNLDLVGGVVGSSGGTISGVTVSGSVAGSTVGGITGSNSGSMAYSQSSAAITVMHTGMGGGLIGENSGTVSQSFATAGVTTPAQGHGSGGLIGSDVGGSVANTYATGAVFTGGAVSGGTIGLGGLIGSADSQSAPVGIGTSYATGAVSVNEGTRSGGFLGSNLHSAETTISDAYWDSTTTGTSLGVGAGSSTGVTGLTTTQLQSGLPAGFDPTIWGQSPSINGGLPYLLALPPS